MAELNKEEKVCKLLISFDIKRIGKSMNKYLDEDDVIQGKEFEIRFRFKNIGEVDFPGGEVGELVFSLARARGGVIKFLSLEERQIPQIQIGKSIPKKWEVIADEAGLVRPTLTILPKEKCKILYCSSENGKGDESFVGYLFDVINREQIETVRLLTEILKELRKEKK